MIRKLFGWLGNPVFLTLIALVVFGLLVWWIGPLVKIGALAPLVTEWARALLIGSVVLLVLLRWGLRRWRTRMASQRLIDGLVKAAPPPAASAPPENPEQKVLAERFTGAVATLKQMRLTAAGRKPGWRDWLSLSGGSYLYELPWYLFIGAPGSGKTTALVNSGLDFPLAEKFGPGAIRGIGGTRNCDWWFTDQAVLIDTAGRYTTQDSHAQQDKGAWDGFLGLLKKSRPRRPLNGVFLTVSVTDLLTQNIEQRAAHAAALRARLLELDGTLAARLPVYVLVTKADLLYGFTGYFADLGKEQRAQVFGFTLPAAESEHIAQQGLGAAFQREFALLRQRLNDGLIKRMQQETDGTRRSAIFGFPAQFGALAPALGDLLEQVFTGSR
ncbi:MAG: type VI secretion system membrane subunit TssM, partial [Burkholderiaceae bacterium]|nr:type VI secretion system membrane subunit TssM [Burkholderiaceae bacterium]